MNDTHSKNENGAGTAVHQEVCTLRRGILGWALIPRDMQDCPLAAQLYGEVDANGRPATSVTASTVREGTIESADVKAACREITEVAKGCGIRVRFCGNLKASPTVLLWKSRDTEVTATPVIALFATRHCAAHRSITDLYEEHEHLLRNTFEQGVPFDTGWFSAKHVSVSARLRRLKQHGKTFIEVSSSSDELNELLDTAIWEVSRPKVNGSCGFSSLLALGLSEDAAEEFVENLLTRIESRAGVQTQSYAERTVSHRASYQTILAKLQSLASQCEAELQESWDSVKYAVALALVEAKLAKPEELQVPTDWFD